MTARWAFPLALAITAAFAYPFLHLLLASWGLAGEAARPALGGGGHEAGAAGPAAYLSLLTDPAFLRAALVSVFLASITAAASTLLAALAGYALALHRFPGRTPLLLALVLLAALPGQLLIPGGYELIARLGLFDTLGAVIVPGMVSVLAALLLRAAFASVPRELLEAARVDGCSELGCFARVALPVVAPTASACMLMGFVAGWNAVVWPAVVLHSEHLQTLPLLLVSLTGAALTPADHARAAAAAVLSILPLLLLFAAAQRAFLPPLGGAVKG